MCAVLGCYVTNVVHNTQTCVAREYWNLRRGEILICSILTPPVDPPLLAWLKLLL